MGLPANKDSYKIWVFAPYLPSEDPAIRYYYDFTQSIAEYTKAFSDMGCEWEWVDVTTENFHAQIARVQSNLSKENIVLNLCDGDDVNGAPGVAVIHALEEAGLVYTGSEAYFYNITNSKILMKQAFERNSVSTPRWIDLDKEHNPSLFKEVGQPLIVKPAASAGSMGIGVKNVVSTQQELDDIVQAMRKGYRGWKLDGAGIFAEQFIAGKEFTCFLVGSYTHPDRIKFYTPVERIFNQALPEKEQFLSFDRLWEFYEDEPMPNEEVFYEYAAVSAPRLLQQLEQLSRLAFCSLKGTGYARLDIRQDKQTGQLYVLEINAQCGLSEDENFTSTGAILRVSGIPFSELVMQILEDALLRHKNKVPDPT
ncbi:MAG: hypothetical protein INR73_24330 [Williamsia sp.]|nr:hypothetical protein [Williamsia sp.]